eukprot:scaffold264569_cov27-Prasinocladus_malaysianus.AAC.2
MGARELLQNDNIASRQRRSLSPIFSSYYLVHRIILFALPRSETAVDLDCSTPTVFCKIGSARYNPAASDALLSWDFKPSEPPTCHRWITYDAGKQAPQGPAGEAPTQVNSYRYKYEHVHC